MLEIWKPNAVWLAADIRNAQISFITFLPLRVECICCPWVKKSRKLEDGKGVKKIRENWSYLADINVSLALRGLTSSSISTFMNYITKIYTYSTCMPYKVWALVISNHFVHFQSVYVFCSNLWSLVIICHLKSFAFNCSQLGSFLTFFFIFGHWRSFLVICDHLRSFSAICGHLRSFAVICGHLPYSVVFLVFYCYFWSFKVIPATSKQSWQAPSVYKIYSLYNSMVCK